MNYVARDLKNFLAHYGMPRRSGRYPWGSGDHPFQHSGDFLSRVKELEKSGMSQKEIAKSLGMTTTQLRTQKALAKDERRADLVATAKSLREKGYSLNEIADKMGFANDSSVRSLLNDNAEQRMRRSQVTANFLKEIVDSKGMIDIGSGVEKELGVSREKLNEALEILKMEGYEVFGGGVPQVTNKGKQTNIKVLCPPGTEHKEIYNFENVHSVVDYDKILTENGDKVRPAFHYPESLDSKRLAIRYAEDGGEAKDGLVELRRGVKDISLGNANYSQVRIMVDGSHYIKGMAVYSDDLPKGVDVLFNTNKTKGTPIMGEKDNSVLKPIKNDPNNPFGSLIKEKGGQSWYIDKDGKEKLSLINKRSDEGDWSDWTDKLPSQFLAKQNKDLIDKQLNLTIADRKAEFDEIKNLTNPTIKRALLSSFADDCDAAAVHLKVAALPRQKYHVLIPMTTVKDNEVYAPNYHDGETVALIRYPHEGTFQIPILKVNNKLKEGEKTLTKTPKDAIGISKKTADKMSGADFDGDAVMVIPTGGKIKISSHDTLRGLEGFDPKDAYGPHTTTKKYARMRNTNTEMGKISNLIMDMTIKGATEAELARAVRHSMTVIDAEKHNLDYKRSYEENGIAALKKKYQGRIENGSYHEGASTLLTRAGAEYDVPKRKGSPLINQKGKDWYDSKVPEGALIYKTAPDKELYYQKNGKTKMRTDKSTQMAETYDARTLISVTRSPKEIAYANYANTMKDMANKARMEMVKTPKLAYSPSAKKVYQEEVNHLDAQLNIALKNKPRERRAQLLANTAVEAKKKEYPDLTTKEIKKISQQELTAARKRVGAERHPIQISDREWDAIQSGAITDSKLKQILDHTDMDKLKERATPRTRTILSDSKVARGKAMRASGYTTDQIAKALGVSPSTISKYLTQ